MQAHQVLRSGKGIQLIALPFCVATLRSSIERSGLCSYDAIAAAVTEVKVIRHLALLVTFEDGTQGEVSISPSWLTGVFEVFNTSPEQFNDVCIEDGAVTWANGLDLAPDSMYDGIVANGKYIIE